VHELSLSSAIVATVEKHATGRRVTLEFYFEFVARGSVCEGATLEQELIAPALRCTPCGREWTLEEPIFRCPSCGGSEVTVAAGNEFEVESIEVEEEACIAPR